MNILPLENLTYDTNLPLSEVIERMKSQTEPLNYFRIQLFQKPSGKLFEGKVGENSFQVQRLINYRNSFVPVIKGHVDEGIFGTKIHISMQLNMFVKAFLMIWASFMLIGILSVLSTMPKQEGLWIAVLVGFGMLLFIVVVAVMAFKYEVKRAKKLLEELLSLSAIF